MKALKRTVWVLGLLLGVASVQAAEVTVNDSNRLSPLRIEPGFSGNFIKDAATLKARQFRIEFSGESIPHYQQIDYRYYDFLASVAPIENSEIGIDVPIVDMEPDNVPGDTDIGDLSFYAKYRVLHQNGLSLTGGLEFQHNSSNQNITVPCGGVPGTVCHTGLAQNGWNPFVATRYSMGNFAVGGHVGYYLFEGNLGDVLNYDVDAILAFTEHISMRVELTGLDQLHGPNRDIFAVAPGLDANFGPVTFRGAGFKGVTDDAADWGLGGGIAITIGGAEAVPPPAPAAPAPAPPPPPPAPPMQEKIVLRAVHFDFDKSNIRADAVPVLDEAVRLLKEKSNVSVVVIGYTDSVGTDAYNLKLSDRRANAVRGYLVDHGIAASRITAEGRGEADPVASNETEDGRAQNRRVELKVK